MTDKQVCELTIDDLGSYSVWFFPMDDTVEDELTIRPSPNRKRAQTFRLSFELIFGENGSVYCGYLYWDSNLAVEYLRPVVLSGTGEAVSFGTV